MKILFVCKSNVGRSQIAQELFNKYTGLRSASAGIIVDRIGNKIKDEGTLAKPVIDFMLREGIDISNNVRDQLTERIINKYDKIIVMEKRSNIPNYLTNSDKVIFRDIEDPKGKSNDKYIEIINRIKKLLKDFIINNNIKANFG